MIPNKPSILVAPNGSGKSSFAFAFQWLNRLRLKLDEDDAYDNNVNNKPKLIITTDEVENNIYKADENTNDISKKFGIFVINNGLRASTPGIVHGVPAGKARITVPDIVLLDGKPDDIDLQDDFEDAYGLENAPVGLYPAISVLIGNNHFMDGLDYESLKITARPASKIIGQLDLIKQYTGTIVERHNKIISDNKNTLEQIDAIIYAKKIISHYCPDDTDVKLLIKAMKLVLLAHRRTDDFKKKIVYAQFKINEESTRKLFEALKRTWKDIKPRRNHDKVILSIGDAQRITNGERDILVLLGLLQKAKNLFTKRDNILIIDEVFDYLDDANLVAAQHYVNQFIAELKDKGKNIFPIILSHINPIYYKTFAFRDMKVYYLNHLQYANASDNMMKLVRKRDDLERKDKPKADLISKYMLHFHPDYSRPMDDVVGMTDPNWNDIPTFKSYCFRQTTEYLNGNRYDSLAVCVALREMIEKYCFSKLTNEDQKTRFLDNSNGTEAKIEYIETLDVVLPETFSLLGLIYNDPLHPNNKNKIDLRQTLYSRLENNTIKGMISEIKKIHDNLA